MAKSRYVDPCAEFAMDTCVKGLGAARRGAARAREGVAHVRRTHVDPRLPERYRLPRKDAVGQGQETEEGLVTFEREGRGKKYAAGTRDARAREARRDQTQRGPGKQRPDV